jgi:hypothetical protein
MTLKQKITNAITLPFSYEKKIKESLFIADEFAIGFANWCEWRNDRAFKTYEELLEIYKKEKGL